MDFQPLLRRRHTASRAEQIADLIENLQEELGDLAGRVERAGSAKRRSAVRMSHSGRAAAETLARDVQRRTKDLIDDRPATSLGIAVGFGILVGILLARR